MQANNRCYVAMLGGLAFAVGAGVARADSVNEAETTGNATNNTLATAETIAPSSFTPNADPNVFGFNPTATIHGFGGGQDVDFFSFTTFTSGPAYFDIDNDPFSFDAYLALFDANGTLLGESDDSFPTDPGSADDRDSFLGVVELNMPGLYYIAVSRYPNTAIGTYTETEELVRPDGEFGGNAILDGEFGNSLFEDSGMQLEKAYTLHVTVPEPGSLMLLLAALAWRRRVRREA